MGGNVRELEGVIQFALVNSEGEMLCLEDRFDLKTGTGGSQNQQSATNVSTLALAAPTTLLLAPLNRQPEHSWRITKDAVAEEVDRKTGKALARRSILWRPSTFQIESGHLFAFTADGRAYAMNR